MILGLIPAAGKSTRMGRPKLSLMITGTVIFNFRLSWRHNLSAEASGSSGNNSA